MKSINKQVHSLLARPPNLDRKYCNFSSCKKIRSLRIKSMKTSNLQVWQSWLPKQKRKIRIGIYIYRCRNGSRVASSSHPWQQRIIQVACRYRSQLNPAFIAKSVRNQRLSLRNWPIPIAQDYQHHQTNPRNQQLNNSLSLSCLAAAFWGRAASSWCLW